MKNVDRMLDTVREAFYTARVLSRNSVRSVISYPCSDEHAPVDPAAALRGAAGVQHEPRHGFGGIP